jgi:hypothetical protein
MTVAKAHELSPPSRREQRFRQPVTVSPRTRIDLRLNILATQHSPRVSRKSREMLRSHLGAANQANATHLEVLRV